MPFHLADVQSQYDKDKNLKKEDVEALMNWAKKQAHLPEINELQAILFLQSCYYKNEAAKNAIDTFFTTKTQHSELFKGKNPSSPLLKETIDNSLAVILPKKTPKGHTIVFLKLMETSTEKFHFVEHIKIFDMVCMLQLHQEGTSEGYIIVADLKGAVFGHLTRVALAGPGVIKKFLLYLQEAMPLRLKELHFVNTVPFMDKILAMIKPFMKMEIMDMLHLHSNVDGLVKYVPAECLPEDYGGSVESTTILHEKVKRLLSENADFFDWEDKQIVDETKRQKKLDNFKNKGGIQGSFKKLEID
ncbi:retinaldehyde-binding protein 1-like isoform X2 [Zophobas morio]